MILTNQAILVNLKQTFYHSLYIENFTDLLLQFISLNRCIRFSFVNSYSRLRSTYDKINYLLHGGTGTLFGEFCFLIGGRGNWYIATIGYKLKLSTGLFRTLILNLVVNFIFLVNRETTKIN